MKTARACRAVVVLGPGTAEIERVLRALGLAPLDDQDADATLWLPVDRAVPTLAALSVVETGRTGPLLLTVVQVAEALGVGRTLVYELIARGELETVHIGRTTRVPARSVDGLLLKLQNQLASQAMPSLRQGTLRLVGASDLSQRRSAS
jgi:excisionase family DNA binding protein